MIFHFQTGTVTFFEEDQAYFEKRLFSLKKMLGSNAGDEDTIDTRVTIEKSKQHSGKRFLAKATLQTSKHGKFQAEVESESIKGCADDLKETLKVQITKFHEKNVIK